MIKPLIRVWLCVWIVLAGMERVLPGETNSPGEILLGMSTALSGSASNLGLHLGQGVLAGLEEVNRAGGVRGRSLRLVAIDDGYEPGLTALNMRDLIEKENVLAVIGNMGTSTAIVAIPIATERKTLLFAAGSGAGVLRRNPPDRYVINYRASYAEEIDAMIDALILGAKLECRDIALFTQRDGYGEAGFDASIEALKRHGLRDKNQVPHVGYERNTLAVEDALATLLYAEHEPRAIIMVGVSTACAKFIKLAHQAGLRPIFMHLSFAGTAPLASDLGDVPARVIVTQVVPHPFDTSLPVVCDYQAAMKTFEPLKTPDFGSLEGYISVRIFVRALETVSGQLTRERVVEALEGLGRFDLGLGAPLKLSRDEHQACHQVWATILRDGALVPFQWSEIGGLLGTPTTR